MPRILLQLRGPAAGLHLPPTALVRPCAPGRAAWDDGDQLREVLVCAWFEQDYLRAIVLVVKVLSLAPPCLPWQPCGDHLAVHSLRQWVAALRPGRVPPGSMVLRVQQLSRTVAVNAGT